MGGAAPESMEVRIWQDGKFTSTVFLCFDEAEE